MGVGKTRLASEALVAIERDGPSSSGQPPRLKVQFKLAAACRIQTPVPE